MQMTPAVVLVWAQTQHLVTSLPWFRSVANSIFLLIAYLCSMLW